MSFDVTAFLTSLLASTVQAGTVYLLATIGEIYAERSGVINLGLEGMMIMGALTSFMVTFYTGNYVLAVFASMLAGLLMSLLHAFISISLKVNQYVSGLALTILGLGLSGFLGKPLVGMTVSKVPEISIPLLSQIPIVGPAFFKNNLFVFISYVVVALSWYFLFKTRIGLNIRSVGENPSMADSLGVNVSLVRYGTTLFGGALAGIAGAYLFIGYQPFWVEGMTAGRGWISIALVIFAAWSPLRAVLGAYLFGGVEALQFRLQALGYGTATPQFLLMLPYILTLVVLTALSYQMLRKKIGVPAALGIPYSREE
jgi:simple sugar transport system permease protein